MNGQLLLGRLQDPNPILVRELRSTLRSPLFRRTVTAMVGVVGLITLASAALAAEGQMLPAEVGKLVLQVFFSVAFGLLCLVAPAQGATAVSGEVEQGTLESLLLTGLGPEDIVGGKVAALVAANGLVLIALLPVVSVAFLFGGVSPVHVLVGFLALGLVLVPAVALGVALSALLRRTRLALLAALGTFPAFALLLSSTTGIVGAALANPWGLSMVGPFWFVDAFVARPGAPETWLFLALLPTLASGLATWLCLVGARTALTPSTDDRSTPFKGWAVAAGLSAVGAMAGVAAAFDKGREAGAFHLVCVVLLSPLFIGVSLVLLGEPRAAPRRAGPSGRPLGRALRRAFGPGLAGTTRFLWTYLPALAALLFAVPSAVRRLTYPGLSEHGEVDLAVGASLLATSALALAALGLGAGVFRRLLGLRPAPARALVLVTGVVLTVGALFATLLVDLDALNELDDRLSPVLAVSPLLPAVVTVTALEAGLVGSLPAYLAAVLGYLLVGLFGSVAALSRPGGPRR